MKNGLILCKLALKNFGNVFLLTLLVFLIKTFVFLEKILLLIKVQVYHKILPHDFVPRVNYSEWFLYNMNNDILSMTFFIDEALFRFKDHVNSQNMRTWSSGNRHV
ncbi:hypothetical protein BDFB_002711 [Asbolus verrucosus]|uniref:Uncharacterized protein n=1 Tax=Asbolus verrucosus TaxID=1661398 RepID=A0A482WCG8_ASBVE|nr:hypothetical protein BDFB_002711 [Asbolus verrucosus]